jgi:hypothetical protein
MRPSGRNVTYTWGRLPLVQKEAVWRLLQTDQIRRRVRAERQRHIVLRAALSLLVAALVATLGLLLVALLIVMLVNGALTRS